MYNRPWDIWWDYKWNMDNSTIEFIVIETNHPKLNGELYRYKVDDLLSEDGYIDYWIDNIFTKIRSDLRSGRASINNANNEYFEQYNMRNIK